MNGKSKIYKIEFKVFFNDGIFKSMKSTVKNCTSELHAKIKLNEASSKKFKNFDRIEITNCIEDVFGNVFGDIFNFKDDIFNFKS